MLQYIFASNIYTAVIKSVYFRLLSAVESSVCKDDIVLLCIGLNTLVSFLLS